MTRPTISAKTKPVVCGWIALLASGCAHVEVYQPVSGLHRPVVVDRQAANFQGLRLQLDCPPGNGLAADEARSMCDKIAQVFENQGAEVFSADERAEGEAAPVAPDLAIEVRSRSIDTHTEPLSRMWYLATLTVLPRVTESSFAQDVTIHDGSGFLLTSDTLRGRLVHREGLGPWAVNKLLDEYWRAPQDRLTGDGAKRDLSEDLYGQLSQLAYNAKVRRELLIEAAR